MTTTKTTHDRDQAAAFVAACIYHQGKILNLNWQQITFAIRYALSIFDQGSSGASAYEAGLYAIDRIISPPRYVWNSANRK